MLKKKYKLSWLVKWWYSHFTFMGEFVSFSEANRLEMFWNILTWYRFFSWTHHVDISWYCSEEVSARIVLWDPEGDYVKIISFYNTPLPLVQIGSELTTYKQVDGIIYEICGDSPIE